MKKKKKIGIITLNGYFNYGNRLQNYAVEQVLKSLGFAVETIIKRNRKNSLMDKIAKIKKMELKELYRKIENRLTVLNYKRIKEKLWYYSNKKEVEKYKSEKTKAFKEFSSKYLTETDYIISPENIPEDLSDKFDYFVTGSDQVWNPNLNPINFLAFAPKEKRIAYAPSFGVSKIPSRYLDKYKIWLSKMSKLSVRERAGARIIKELTGRDATVLVDPTMMLTKETWLSISKEATNKPDKRYLLTYILGELSKERKERIETIAKKNNLELVNLANIKEPKTFIADPSEFIDYINSASLVYTDSFHGTVFSILFETPFIVFNRQGNSLSMFSRIDNLLDKFKLKSRIEGNVKDDTKIFKVNFSQRSSVLKEERNKTYRYLKEALGLNNNS